MASSFSKQIIKDSTTETVVKFVGYVDGSANTPQTGSPNTVLAMASLVGAYDTNNALRSSTGGAVRSLYRSNIRKVVWSVGATPANSAIQLAWRGGGSNANVVVFNFASGSGELDFSDGTTGGSIATDSAVGLGANAGDLIVASSSGLSAASYTLVVVLKKDPRDFDRGALVDKAYFQNP